MWTGLLARKEDSMGKVFNFFKWYRKRVDIVFLFYPVEAMLWVQGRTRTDHHEVLLASSRGLKLIKKVDRWNLSSID